MSDIIAEYQKWKQQGEDLRTQAKRAMETRFRELMTEAVAVAEEYRADFGAPLKPPTPVTAFRYKAAGKAKKAAKTKPSAARQAPSAPAPEAKANPKVAALEKRLAAARKKLDNAKAAGTPTRVLEDRVYEIEDELKLATQA
ncbi:MAG TPA: hypothetical protein VGS58_11985 [Candidatus Sulfopaludibacter sp.]|nr:hypothetical protein [Candidatus Sulfopaludibacter sp.]